MIVQSAAFAQMVAGQDQTVAWQVNLSLPGNVYPNAGLSVSDVQLGYSLTSDLPQGTRQQEGFAVQQATITLTGLVDPTNQNSTAFWLFSQWSTTSPLYRTDLYMTPVTVALGLAPEGSLGLAELTTKFTGFVKDVTPNADGSVTFTCLDGRLLLRPIPSTPLPVTTPPYNAGLTPEFPIDAMLRAATGSSPTFVSSSPATPTGCVLSATLRTSLAPEVGSVMPFGSTAPVFTTGVYGSALVLTPTGGAVYSLTAPIQTRMFLRCWVSNLTSSASGASPSVALVLNTANVLLPFGISVGSDGVSLGSSAYGVTSASANLSTGGHCIEVLLTAQSSGYGYSGTIWIDGAATSVSTTSGNTTFGSFSSLTLQGYAGTIEAVAVGRQNNPSIGGSFTPTALIDPSLNVLQTIPPFQASTDNVASPVDAWQMIQQIAQAENAVAYFNESGQFVYRNRLTIASQPVPALTVTSTGTLLSVGSGSSTADSVVNHCQVGYTGYTFATTASTVWSLGVVRVVRAGQTRSFTANLNNNVYGIDTTVSLMLNGSTDATQSWFRASTTSTGANAHPGGLVFTVTQPAGNQILVTVQNTSRVDAWLVSPASDTDLAAGTPVLYIGGFPLTTNAEVIADYQYPPLTLGGAASSTFREVALQVTGNVWSQDPTSALMLAQSIVNGNYRPSPSFTGIDILPDPRLQLGDVVQVVDSSFTGVNDFMRVFGYTLSWSMSDPSDGQPAQLTYTHSVNAVCLGPPGCWLSGVPGRSESGVNAYAM